MKLLIDEMWSHTVAEQLRERGSDARSVLDDDLRSSSDVDLLALAGQEGRVVVTENVADFRFLVDQNLARGQSHGGLVYTTPASFFRGDPRSVGRLVRALEDLLGSGADLTNREMWIRPLGQDL